MTAASDIEPYAARVCLAADGAREDVASVVASALQRIAENVVAAGSSLIGHIKCYAALPDGRYLACSLTSLRGGPSCRGTAGGRWTELCLDLNVLVYGLPREAIDVEVRRALATAALEGHFNFTLAAVAPPAHEHDHHEAR
jgi:hypothetical protein